MKSLCLMPTYNRPTHGIHVLHDAVCGFLAQEDKDAILVILNDTPGQKLEMCRKTPGVVIHNLDVRLPSLGAKLNWILSHHKADLVYRWDDDDISLPGRLAQGREKIYGKLRYWKPQHCWVSDNTGVRVMHGGVNHNAGVFAYDVWEGIGGYPEVYTDGEDVAFDRRVIDCGIPHVVQRIPSAEFQYLYRWNSGASHVSMGGRDTQAGYDRYAGEEIKEGVFKIDPRKSNYRELVESVLTGQTK